MPFKVTLDLEASVVNKILQLTQFPSFQCFVSNQMCLSTASECEWSWNEEKAAGTYWRTPTGAWSPEAQHLLSLLVWMLQMPLVHHIFSLCFSVS